MIHTSSIPATSSAVAIGKFAQHAEYLRPSGAGLSASFDSWLAAGFDDGQERFGPAWQAMFQMGIPHGFLWRAGDDAGRGAAFCGVVAPSRDAVGRQYPLAIGATVADATLARAPHAAPLALGSFLSAAYATISEARAGALSRIELAERVQSLALPTTEAFSVAERQYTDWCRTVPADVGWGALFASPDPLRLARAAISNLAEVGRSGGTPCARLPVGAEPAGATALWLDVIGRAWRGRVATALWSLYDGALLVAAGDPGPDLLGCLWMRDAAATSMIDLRDLALQLPPSGPVAADSTASMADFLATVAT